MKVVPFLVLCFCLQIFSHYTTADDLSGLGGLGSLGDMGNEGVEEPEELGGCPPPPNIQNATKSSNDMTVTSVVTYTCKKGLERTAGDASRVCGVNLKWSGKDIVCKKPTCPPLKDIPHTSRSNRATTVYTVTTFECKVPYEKTSGDAVRLCQRSKKWTGKDLACTLVECPVLNINNTDRNSSQVVMGTAIRFMCGKNFIKFGGDEVRVCLQNKTWAGEDIKCRSKTCPQYHIGKHVKPSTLSTDIGTNVTFNCTDYAHPGGGNRHIQCMEDMTWSGRPLVCLDNNVAVGKPAFQSATYCNGWANRATDGSKNSLWQSNSCSHTKTMAAPWWAVDLKGDYNVVSVSLTNRGDCCGHRLAKFTIAVTNKKPKKGYKPENSTICYSRSEQVGNGATEKFKCVKNLRGRFVVVSLNFTSPLTLCEVQVIAQDLRFFKRARQSSTYLRSVASRATDGNSSPDVASDTCSCTKTEKNPWWAAELVKNTTKIKSISMAYPNDRFLERRMANFTISVTNKKPGANFTPAANETCYYQKEPMSPGQSKTFKCSREMSGRYVVVSINGTSTLSLCEVTVR